MHGHGAGCQTTGCQTTGTVTTGGGAHTSLSTMPGASAKEISVDLAPLTSPVVEPAVIAPAPAPVVPLIDGTKQ